MPLNNTTFDTVGIADRDDSDEKGAVYVLTGATIKGRLNISAGRIWTAGDDTQIIVAGNAGHSYMLGTIIATRLTYIAQPTGTGRLDFGSPSSAYKCSDMTFVYQGSGNIYNHLEGGGNNFKGFTRFVFSMASGTGFIQFASREYSNVSIIVSSSNAGTPSIYVARSSAGHTSLTNFSTQGITGSSTLEFRKGNTSTSSVRIYDPVYKGATNNTVSLQMDTDVRGNRGREYFTLDVTALSVRAKILVKQAATVQHDKLLTAGNCTLYANDGTTKLTAYEGKRVVECKVREFRFTPSTTRNPISYTIRQAGFLDFKVVDSIINGPVVISELTIDEFYTNTSGSLAEVSTMNELYDLVCQAKASDFSIPEDIFSVAGKRATIKTGYTLVRDQSVSGVQVTATQIKVKTASNGLQKTESLETLAGVVDNSFTGHTNVSYVKANGKVNINLNIITGVGITGAVWAVWLQSDDASRGSLVSAVSGGVIEGTPGVALYYIADGINAYRTKPIPFTVGAHGSSLEVTLIKITKPDGSNIIPDTLTTAQQAIAATAIYNSTAGTVDVKLPVGYTANSRWDAVNKVWRYTEEDFKAFAYKVDHIQSTQAALRDVAVVRIEDYALILSQNSSLVFRQESSNVDCEINLEAWTTKREGGGNRVFYSYANGPIVFSKGNPVIASVSGGFDNTSKATLAKLNFDSSQKLLVTQEQSEFNSLLNSVPAEIKAAYQAGSLDTSSIVDAMLNVNFGKLSDGTTSVKTGTLGEHWYQFYPPEIIRQLLESMLDGKTVATRYKSSPGTYGTGTLGDALRRTLASSALGLPAEEQAKLDAIHTATNAKDLAQVSDVGLTASEKTALASIVTLASAAALTTEEKQQIINIHTATNGKDLATQSTLDSVATALIDT